MAGNASGSCGATAAVTTLMLLVLFFAALYFGGFLGGNKSGTLDLNRAEAATLK